MVEDGLLHAASNSGSLATSQQSNVIPRWEALISEQTELLKHTFQTNVQLTSRVEELERELSVWKNAYTSRERQESEILKKNEDMKRYILGLQDDYPINMALIDGDGNIFSSELLQQGAVGGRQAALILTRTLASSEITSHSRSRLWITIFLNKQGLQETLSTNSICTKEIFSEFCEGFSQASPMFTIVDVGGGKEAADTKIKEYLRVFAVFPQINVVFFGGGHDNGYLASLTALENEGFLRKLILLKGYRELAQEIRNLKLPEVELEGLFMKDKIKTHWTNTNTNKQNTAAHPAAKRHGGSFTGSSTSTPKSGYKTLGNAVPTSPGIPGHTRNAGGGSMDNGLIPDPNIPLDKLKPPLCTFYYLAAGSCHRGAKCTYNHSYNIPISRLEEVRKNARKFPCVKIRAGKECKQGDKCYNAHRCPYGITCRYWKGEADGKACRFSGPMHTATAGPTGQGPVNTAPLWEEEDPMSDDEPEGEEGLL